MCLYAFIIYCIFHIYTTTYVEQREWRSGSAFDSDLCGFGIQPVRVGEPTHPDNSKGRGFESSLACLSLFTPRTLPLLLLHISTSFKEQKIEEYVRISLVQLLVAISRIFVYH